MSGAVSYIGRKFTPEGKIMGIDWASMNSGEQKNRESTVYNEAAPARAKEASVKATAADAARLAAETAGKPTTRPYGRARGAATTVFASKLGAPQVANLARKYLLGA